MLSSFSSFLPSVLQKSPSAQPSASSIEIDEDDDDDDKKKEDDGKEGKEKDRKVNEVNSAFRALFLRC